MNFMDEIISSLNMINNIGLNIVQLEYIFDYITLKRTLDYKK